MCGLLSAPRSRVQTLPRLPVAKPQLTTHTTRNTMLRRCPESSETLPSALLAPRTSFRKIASARTLNAPKSCDLACARDAHRRSDKASIVRSAPPGPPTGRSATHKRTPRPELATLSGLRAAWRASSSRSESCRPRSAARFLRHRVQRSRGVRPGEYTGRVTCANAPGLVAAFRLWSARHADRVYRAHSPYQEATGSGAARAHPQHRLEHWRP